MKMTIKTAIIGLLMVPVIALGSIAIVPTSAFAVDCNGNSGKIIDGVTCANGGTTPTNLFGANGMFTKISNAALFVIGALSVLMLIYGGIRYTISMGDSKHIETAKNTIMYAIIGIVIALLAAAIVNFVVVRLATS